MAAIESYGEDPLQHVKIFHYNSANQKNVVFIHGGGWRDPNNTVDDFAQMIEYIHSKAPELNLFSINYRLSPKVKHPCHLVDVISALQWLNSHYGIVSTSLVGHSVGATLCLQLLNYKQLLAEEANNTPDLLKVKLEKVFLLDGIFDVVKLVEEYGAPYEEFINSAFISKEHYKRAIQLSNEKFHVPGYATDFEAQLYIVYSLDDELISPKQHQLLEEHYSRYFNVSLPVLSGHWGHHEQMYRSDEVSQVILDNLE